MVDLDKSVMKRNDLRCPGAPVGLNPNAVLKILCYQPLFSENDQFCSLAKQRPIAEIRLYAARGIKPNLGYTRKWAERLRIFLFTVFAQA